MAETITALRRIRLKRSDLSCRHRETSSCSLACGRPHERSHSRYQEGILLQTTHVRTLDHPVYSLAKREQNGKTLGDDGRGS
jgi:hypothetical protein